MNLYLVSRKDKKLLGTAEDEHEAFKKMNEFLDSKDIHPPYYRKFNINKDGKKIGVWDFGSHSEFIYLEESD